MADDDSDDFEVWIDDIENKRFYSCAVWEKATAVHWSRIFTSSLADAAQSMVETVFESTRGEWQGGRLTVTNQATGEMTEFKVSISATRDDAGEVEANVQIEEL